MGAGFSFRAWGRVVAGLVLIGGLASGCSRSVAQLDALDRGKPLMKLAADKQRQGDYEAAARLYTQAVEADPRTALAHLQLGLIYHDELKDYVRAIYHYQRYLELRPDTQKQQLIRDRIRLAKQAFAGELLKHTGTRGEKWVELETQNTKLKKEVAALKQRVAVLEGENKTLRRRNGELAALHTGRAAADKPHEPAAPGSGRGIARTYRVKPGDSLSSIARDVYGDGNRWREIWKANAKLLGKANRLRVGQVLVIP